MSDTTTPDPFDAALDAYGDAEVGMFLSRQYDSFHGQDVAREAKGATRAAVRALYDAEHAALLAITRELATVRIGEAAALALGAQQEQARIRARLEALPPVLLATSGEEGIDIGAVSRTDALRATEPEEPTP